MRYRQFQLSSDLFWGWQSNVDIDVYSTIELVVNKVKDDLKNYLQKANLIELVEKLQKTNFHCHMDTQKIFYDKPHNNEIFYLCDHC
jgi:hypothetical protein